MATAAAKKAESTPDLSSAFAKTQEETPTRPAGPSYKALSFAFALTLHEVPGVTPEMRQVLRTRDGISAWITMMKDKHGVALDAERDAAQVGQTA